MTWDETETLLIALSSSRLPYLYETENGIQGIQGHLHAIRPAAIRAAISIAAFETCTIFVTPVYFLHFLYLVPSFT